MNTKVAIKSPPKTIFLQIDNNRAKRVFDVIFSASVLFFLSPIYLFIATIIRLASPGKVIYSQLRLGQGGRFFRCYKFRTMHSDADLRLAALLSSNNALKQEWERKQKLKNDPRVFRFGSWLRKYSLDELPQFWNVLKGDLSVVGPRPYMVSQKNMLGLYTKKILSVRPGITGIWQTSGRSSTDISGEDQARCKICRPKKLLARYSSYSEDSSSAYFWRQCLLIRHFFLHSLFF